MPLETLTGTLSVSDTSRTAYSPSSRLSSLPALIPQRRRTPPQKPLPVQETPTLSLPPNLESVSYLKPLRRVFSPLDHELFLKSPSYSLVLAFVFSLSEACANTKISAIPLTNQPPIIRNILTILSSISSQVELNPPKDQGTSRFGNPAFRDFFDAVSACLGQYQQGLGGPTLEAMLEASSYLQHSLGSRARIDYGSGHELNFVLWLLCLNRLSLLPPSTFPALALLVFPEYIHLLRKIQSTYYLEPAGSHGVWGLDDYHFLPFLFGASQLLHHPYIRPLSVHNEIILEEEGDEYMYLDMVRWTMAIKSVKGLKWTQPMLDDISGAKSWEKVEQGMRRMFVKEVLEKLPVMQHFLFGSLIPAVDGMGLEEQQLENVHGSEARSADHTEVLKHIHNNYDAWGDCCGIKIPSIIAAAQEAKKWRDEGSFRTVPFD
ncbi:Serine/threonine-protein phosphatase 2A activator 2 [Xylographa carneopallida]|nr:Serine/threonine-protein phosphatase 2A activator 2 [Xylographa carneopallida]